MKCIKYATFPPNIVRVSIKNIVRSTPITANISPPICFPNHHRWGGSPRGTLLGWCVTKTRTIYQQDRRTPIPTICSCIYNIIFSHLAKLKIYFFLSNPTALNWNVRSQVCQCFLSDVGLLLDFKASYMCLTDLGALFHYYPPPHFPLNFPHDL